MLATEIITRTGSNLLKVGTVLLLSTLASTALKEQSSHTMHQIARDYRKIRTDFKERNQNQLETN